jgi:ATP adenylyltransferase
MNQDLWAPWRMAYIRELDRKQHEVTQGEPVLSDFISQAWENPSQDLETLVVIRNEFGLVMLNRYPYSNGHLLIALGDARPRILDYSPLQREAFWKLVENATTLVEACFNPHGINMGINQGDAAGAGLPQHLHAHVLPRWTGDVNFISTIGGVRVVPESLESVAERLRKAIDDGVLENPTPSQ